MSKDFTKNIGPKKSSRKKPSDAEIEKALDAKSNSKRKTKTVEVDVNEQTTINIRMPKLMYNELKKTAKKSGVSMSSIIKQGLSAELKRLNQ